MYITIFYHLASKSASHKFQVLTRGYITWFLCLSRSRHELRRINSSVTLYYVVTEVDIILIQFLGKFNLQVMNFVLSQFALRIFRSLNIVAMTQRC